MQHFAAFPDKKNRFRLCLKNITLKLIEGGDSPSSSKKNHTVFLKELGSKYFYNALQVDL